MQTLHPSIPGYRLNEYLLVLSPNEELRNRIMQVKKAFFEKYKSPVAVAGRPHLSLVKFVTWNMMEEKIVSRFRHIAMGVCPFKVELRDFGSFPSHTIYIQVPTRVPVERLVKELKSVQRMMKAHPDHTPHFMSEPHISIARKLLPWQFEKGWLEYSNIHFSAKMIADGMLLLKRPMGSGSYQVVSRFDFLNMPVATRQGDLFLQ